MCINSDIIIMYVSTCTVNAMPPPKKNIFKKRIIKEKHIIKHYHIYGA